MALLAQGKAEQDDGVAKTKSGFSILTAEGDCLAADRPVASELPVAIEFNGLGYAVLMASDSDFVDLAYGFALAERVAAGSQDIIDVDRHVMPNGIVLRITLAEHRLPDVVDRVRHRVSESGCGLCGIENLEQAMRPLPSVKERSSADGAAIFRALALLAQAQPMNAATGAVHAAALCDADGAILLVREDVGRHNAFDKLIGAMMRSGRNWDGGFALLTSRCSYELVEKAVLAGCPMLVTISAPTDLAIARARDSDLTLLALARSDSLLIVNRANWQA